MHSPENHRAQEGISIQFTSTQLLQEPTKKKEGFKAHAKHMKEQGLGVSSPPGSPNSPPKAEEPHSTGNRAAELGLKQPNRANLHRREVCSGNRQRLLYLPI